MLIKDCVSKRREKKRKEKKRNFIAIFFGEKDDFGERWWENMTSQRQRTEYQNTNPRGPYVQHTQSVWRKFSVCFSSEINWISAVLREVSQPRMWAGVSGIFHSAVVGQECGAAQLEAG